MDGKAGPTRREQPPPPGFQLGRLRAGTVQRAPPAWQRWGLEWLWRIRQEPQLFKRYWGDGWALLGLAVRALGQRGR